MTNNPFASMESTSVPVGLIGPKPFLQHYGNIGTIEGYYFNFSSVINEINKETAHRHSN